MKLQFGPFLVMLALSSAPVAWSQTSGDSSQSGSSQQQSSEGPQPVFTHPEDRPPMALLDEVTAQSYINLGLGASLTWDSNGNTFGYQHYSQTYGIISPSIQLKQTHAKFMWYAGAAGGLTVGSTYYPSSNPSAGAGFVWQISQRWQLVGNDNYVYTADPFQQYLTLSSAPTYNQPNPTVYVPLTTTQQNYGNLDLNYEITAHDSLTFSGSQSLVRYLHTTYSAYDLYSWGGFAAYQHVFSARLSAGGAYSFTALDFGHGTSRSGVSMIQAFASYQLSPHMMVTGWIGPEYTGTKNEIPLLCLPTGCFIEVKHNSGWNTAYGGNFVWNGQRNAVSARFFKSISNGGLLFGIVQLYQVNANFTRQLNPRWSMNIGMLYGNNTGYSTRLHRQHLNSLTANVGFVRQLTPALSAGGQYIRFYETQENLIGFANAAPKWIDNRIQFTVQYSWGHSLGR